ncbi:Hypothetical predicted protein [Mytilus galloprovincialis]|uniref:RNase H type-1 domain-containing protein n=1 Tax=Mytilus galloprovincialis TaxID=29158 RepID=A0A8B6GGF5_MYTGA|nr:Hypothetical predicted protein [Mytilus galloprovincialis]
MPCRGLDLLVLRVILIQAFTGQGFHGQGFPGQGFPNQVFPSQVPSQPFPGFWPYCGPTPVIVPQSTTPNLSVPAPPLAVSSSCSSVSVPAALPTSSVRHQFNQLPQAAKKKVFTSDEDDNSVQVSQNVSQPSVPVSISSSVIGQSSTNSRLHVACPVDDTKSHTSFPQSNHMSNSLQIINDGIVANESQFSSVSGFGLASFTEQFRSKDYDIFDSTLVIRGGLTLQFKEQPPLSPVPIPLSNTQDPQKFLLLSTEVETLLTKRAVEEVPVSSIDPGFYSRLFLVSKKTGGMRPVIDLSILNFLYDYSPFQNGDQSFNKSFYSSRYVDNIPGSDGRLFSCSSLPFIPQIPSVCLEQKGLPIQGSPFWSVNCTTSLYQTHAADVVPLGRLHIRPLQFYLHQHWLPATQDWEFPVPIIHQELFPHLVWWTSQANVLRGQLLSSPVPNQTLFTDASNLGWGAYLEGLSVSGVWTPDLLKEHINILEMKAVLLALSHFQSLLQNKSLVLATDNTTVVAYLRNQGGTHCYELYLLAREILLLCNHLHLQIVVRHVPGKLNVLADALSRTLTPVNTEWELLQSVFQAITLQWGSPHVDLFATSLNYKVQVFMSPVPDPKAYAVDCMSVPWDGMFAYAFPPFRFLSQVLRKISAEQGLIILIAPAWPKQAWFPDLLHLSCARPLVLPVRHNLLSQFKGKILHPNPEKLHLFAWLLSGIASRREVFLNAQPDISPEQLEIPLTSSMMPSGLSSSVVGVVRRKLILSKFLYNN